jgi:CspA family cold shock protein
MFTVAFDGALAARGNPAEARDVLRRAAADLMRAGARTIIVLERLGAAAAGSPKQRAPTTDRVSAQRALDVIAPEVAGLASAVEGTVKWYNPKKGIGFVTVGDGKDVFVRAQTLKRSGLPGLQVGQAVRLTTRPAPKGPEADRIELVSGSDRTG